MKVTCGTDIVEISRITENIDNTKDKFVNRVFTEKEVWYCEKKSQRAQHYAVRFAAKEATFKALSGYLDNKYSISWKDMEVLNDERGKPFLELKNIDMNNIESIDISMSHCDSYATANVVILWK